MTIRWGIIGCGKVCEVKSGPGFQKAEGSELAFVMRRDAALAEDYARRHGVARWTTSAEELICDPIVDAVYIATPPGTHCEYALRVAAAGKPAYVEKPMARNHAECQRMISAFADAKLPLFVAYYRRRLPRFLTVKELVDAGRVGQVTMLQYSYASNKMLRSAPGEPEWRIAAEQSGGGHFLDLGSHALDIFDYILGPIEEVHGAAVKLSGCKSESGNLPAVCDVEDGVAMHCRFACGAMGIAAWNFAAYDLEDTISIAGTLGKITLSVFGNEPVTLATAAGVETFDRPNPPHIQQPLIQSMVDELSGRGTSPSTGESAARTTRVMDQVLADYYGGRDDAFWTRPETWPGRK
jgi:predicted dehydrogenase